MSFLCNATRFNVRCHICDVGTHPLLPAVWRPPGRRQGKKPRFRVKSASSDRFWGRFRAISAPACQHPGTSVIWRTLAASARPARTFSRVHRLRADPFAGAPGRVAPGGSLEPALGTACFRSVPGIGNRSTPSRVAVRKRRSTRPRARLRLARHSGSRPRRGRGPVVRRARY
jgi:hypothetical protein